MFLYQIISVRVFIESCSPRARLHAKHLANPPPLSLVWLNPSPSRSLVTPSGAPGGGVLNKHTPHTSPSLPRTGKYFPFPKAISAVTARHAAAQHLTSPKTAGNSFETTPKILVAFPSRRIRFRSRCTRVLRAFPLSFSRAFPNGFLSQARIISLRGYNTRFSPIFTTMEMPDIPLAHWSPTCAQTKISAPAQSKLHVYAAALACLPPRV